MNKTAIKNFAVNARVSLMEAARQRAYEYEIVAGAEPDRNLTAVGGRVLSSSEKEQRKKLVSEISAKGYEQVIEEAAYTWFNRFAALRYMEVNGYLPSHIRVFTDENGSFKPEILKEAMSVEIDGIDRARVFDLIDKQDNEGLFKYLVITQCNALGKALPGMFEHISDYTELLFPNNLLRPDSVLAKMVEDIPEEDWKDQVQIIGWLYQYYNSALKDETFALLKKNVKITKERIPAATQLFTPDWIVRYMVENSLGRLWVEGHENAELKKSWKYYIEEAEQEQSVKEELTKIRNEYSKISPEEIRFIDPCMGSGHILVYAFDVFMQIYELQGYSQRDAARLILEKNIHGLDIDNRAYQLAYFAIMMKARQYNRRILDGNVSTNLCAVCDSSTLTEEVIKYISNGNEKIRASLHSVSKDLCDAKEYGSILNVNEVDFDALYARFDEIADDFDADLFSAVNRNIALTEILPLIKQAQIMAQKYDVVCTNPPYMGSSGMSAKLADYVKNKYPNSKADLFAVFIERGLQMLDSYGYNCMVTMQSWMFLSSFEGLRKKILKNCSIETLLHMENMVMGIAFGTAVAIIQKIHLKDFKGTYNQIKLCDIENDVPKSFPVEGNRFYQISSSNFSKIPSSPIAYWVSENVTQIFSDNKTIDEIAYPRQGLATGNNEHYLRLWTEVSYLDIKRDAYSHEDFFNSAKKYIPYNKGGAYRKWFANIEWIIRFDKKNYDVLQTVGNHLPSKDFYFRESITWSKVTSGGLSMRYIPRGSVFDVAGCSIFADKSIYYILAFVNTKIMQYMMNVLSQTLNYEVGNVKSIPLVISEDKEETVEKISEKNVESSFKDLSIYETSWDFKRNPLV